MSIKNIMKITIVNSLTALILLWLASPASAQIISTMVPTQGAASTASPVAFHVMGGYTSWRFGFVETLKDDEAKTGGTVTGGRNGFIGAVDLAVRAGDNISVGAGGWMNKVGDLVTTEPNTAGFFGLTDTQTISVFSAYGNVFYNHIGVQAGIVPIRSQETVVFNNGQTLNGSDDQTDMDVFAVGRFGATGLQQARWSAMFGAGLYRYGSRPASAEFGTPESPSAGAFTGFANGSVGIYKGLSLDLSFWYTAKDKNYTTTSVTGNASQARFTVGVGYGR
jgi:hypothetical protein